MRPTANVEKLGQVARRRFLHLRSLSDSVKGPLAPSDDRLIAYCTIEARTTWDNFCRMLFLCCVLHARDQTGARITYSAQVPSTVDDGVDFAVRVHNPNAKGVRGKWSPRNEPPWLDRNVFAKIIGQLGPSNAASIQLGLDIQSRAFADVPVFRNFFAHRSIRTAKAASRLGPKYSLPSSLHPSQIAASVPGIRPQSVLSDWLDDLKSAAVIMTS